MVRAKRWHWIVAVAALLGGLGIHTVSASDTRTAGEVGFGGTEIVNPGRGQYRWGGLTTWGDDDGEYFPNSAAPTYPPNDNWPGGSVSYYRFNWRQLEPSQGQYDFSVIDAKIDAAAKRGERFGFRVMVVDSCCAPRTGDDRPQIFPDWMNASVNSWRYRSGDADAIIPDWNDPDYLSAAERLVKALGRRYDGDDRVGFVDMLGYGNFGEWHLYPWEGQTGPQGQRPLTDANAERLVDANVAAFPRTTVLGFTPHSHALTYTMTKYPRVGLRVDSVGDASGGWAWPRMMDVPEAMNRWKTAPVVTEWATANTTTSDQLRDDRYASMRPDVGRDMYAVGRGQVMRWHLSLLSSGNFPHAWNGERMSEQQFADWSMANRTAGYRYSVALKDAPATVSPGQSVSISTTWQNAGVAPAYESWNPRLELRPRGQTEPVVRQRSGIDLNTLCAESTASGSTVPATATRTVTDSVAVPADVAPGAYDIVVVVGNQPQKSDPTATMPREFYDRPVALAQSGGTSDGGFKIGEITVS